MFQVYTGSDCSFKLYAVMYAFFTPKLRNRHHSLSCIPDFHLTAEKLRVLDIAREVTSAQQDNVLVLFFSHKERTPGTEVV